MNIVVRDRESSQTQKETKLVVIHSSSPLDLRCILLAASLEAAF